MSSSIMPDVATARALLREIGMVVSEDHIVRVPNGTINTTFRVSQGKEPPLYLRIAPNDAEVEAGPGWMTSHGLRREIRVIEMLEPIASLLPRAVHTDWSRAIIDRDWVVQSAVRGVAWADARKELTPEEDIAVWRQLGTVARELHTVIGEAFGPPEEGFGHEAWSELVRWDVTGFLVDAQRFDIEEDPFRRLTALVNGTVEVLDEVTEPRLIHSDLHPRHVYVGRDGGGEIEITGLIDLEFARFADPFSESVFVLHALNGGENPGFDAFCEAYGCEEPTRPERLRSVIYQLTALGWTVMDLHRRGQQEAIPDVLNTMNGLLDDAESLS